MQCIFNHTVPLSDFGLESEDRIAACRPGSWSERSRILIPKVHPGYVFQKETLGVTCAWWEMATEDPLFISGPHGSGKTSFVRQFCARVHVPVVAVTARARLERCDLIGQYVIDQDKSMKFVDGPLTTAWRYGFVLLVNEMSAAPADLWLSVNELLEGQPLFIESTGEVIEKHPRTRIIFTDNTRGISDDDMRYQGRYLQDPAVMDRCWKLRMEYIDEASEIALLKEGIPKTEVYGMSFEGWREEFCLRLRKAAARVRNAYVHPDTAHMVEATVSTRVLLRLRDLLILSWKSPVFCKDSRSAMHRALRIALTESITPTSALAIERLVEAEIGDIGKHLSKACFS